MGGAVGNHQPCSMAPHQNHWAANCQEPNIATPYHNHARCASEFQRITPTKMKRLARMITGSTPNESGTGMHTNDKPKSAPTKIRRAIRIAVFIVPPCCRRVRLHRHITSAVWSSSSSESASWATWRRISRRRSGRAWLRGMAQRQAMTSWPSSFFSMLKAAP